MIILGAKTTLILDLGKTHEFYALAQQFCEYLTLGNTWMLASHAQFHGYWPSAK